MIHDTHADGQLTEAHTPDTHAGALLLERVLVTGRYNHHGVVHGCLQNVYQWYAAIHYLQGLAQLQRGGLAPVLLQSGHGGLRGRGVLNTHLYTGLAVKALGLGHIIAGKLRLRRPLGGKHNGFVLCRHCKRYHTKA